MTKKVLPKEASTFTKKVNNQVKEALPFENTKDLMMQGKALLGHGIM